VTIFAVPINHTLLQTNAVASIHLP